MLKYRIELKDIVPTELIGRSAYDPAAPVLSQKLAKEHGIPIAAFFSWKPDPNGTAKAFSANGVTSDLRLQSSNVQLLVSPFGGTTTA